MTAVWLPRLGGIEVLEIAQRPVPTPGPKDVLVRVHASSVNPRDTLIRAGRYPFQALIRLPIIPGSDLSGVVVERGAEVASLEVGEAVFGMQPSRRGFGAHAEYAVVDADVLAPKPPSLSFEEAAGMPLAALTALQALRDNARLQAGQRVLINGASGGVGTFAVQIACALGARVTAVTSGRNRELVHSLGAHRCLDYRAHDIRDASTLEDGAPYDAVFDVIGNHHGAGLRQVMAAEGVYVTTLPRRRQIWQWGVSVLRRSLGLGGRRSSVVLVRADGQDLRQLGAWATAGRLRTVIERVLPLTEVATAHQLSQTRRTRGKLILRSDSLGSEPEGVAVEGM